MKGWGSVKAMAEAARESSKRLGGKFNEAAKEAAASIAANIESNIDATALSSGGGGAAGSAADGRASERARKPGSVAGGSPAEGARLRKPSGGGDGGGRGGGGGDATGGSTPSGVDQYVKLPLASARKLRFYDNGDLTQVIAGHLEEKQALAEENARLMIELEAALGGAEEVRARLEGGGKSLVAAAAERARSTEDGVNRVMLISARAELDRLRGGEIEAKECFGGGKEEAEMRGGTEGGSAVDR